MTDHLSVSSIRTWLRCPRQWAFAYIEKIKIPPGGAQHLGSSFHRAAEENHRQKITTDVDLPADELEDRFEVAFDNPRTEIKWDAAPAKLKDDGIKVTRLYAKQVAPTIHPTHVEQVIITPIASQGEQIPALMTVLDVVVPEGVTDLKTTARTPSEGAAHASDQLTAYSLAHRQMLGALPPTAALEFLVRPTKTSPGGRHIRQASSRTTEQVGTFLVNVKSIASQIAHANRTGLYPYADPESMWCSERSCGYWFICPGGLARRTQVAISFSDAMQKTGQKAPKEEGSDK